jgi:uncharacterized membrane protein YGL010W
MHTFVRLLTLEPLERHPGRVFAAIGFVFAVVYLAAFTVFPRHGRIIDGDAIQYYAYLRSLVIDRDVDFTNDYPLLYTPADSSKPDNVWLSSQTSRGRPPNLMSIGPALLWAPAFLATYATVALLRGLGLAIPLDGLAAPFLLSVGVAGIGYATLGAFFCYRSCRLLFPARPALWGALVAWLATPAVYYSLISPAYSHATSLFASALFCFVWLNTRGSDGIRRDVWLGILAGLATLVRWQDIVILVLPLSELAWSVAKGRSRLASSALHATVMLGVAVTMLLPQFFAWQAIYGRLFLVPQGGGFMQWSSPALASVLLSLRHGLFSWTPAVLVAVLGFYYLVRRDAVVGWSAVVVFLLAVYINASVSDWWAGEAFGARRFVGYSVLFALGLAALFAGDFWQKRPALLRWTAAALVVYNLLFLLQYQLFMRGFEQFAPYPTTVRQVLFDRLTLPWQLLRAWMGH